MQLGLQRVTIMTANTTLATTSSIDTESPPISQSSEKSISFADLELITELVQGVTDVGYTTPTPIQEKTIPIVLEGSDLLATAQTGSGKTAAFVLPVLQKIERDRGQDEHPRVLILSPVRELASQIAKNMHDYGKYVDFNQVTIYGGVSQKPQVKRVNQGVDVVIATPGRLIDLINQRKISLTQIEIFVLDEADRMLDMGFIDDIRELMGYMPENKQVLLYSATMPEEIIEFADEIQNQPIKVEVDAPATTVDTVDSTVLFVKENDKFNLLMDLLNRIPMDKVLIFVKTKRSVDKIYKKLREDRFYVALIHGDKTQKQREAALDAFKTGEINILVATDVASRGIDVDDITHVINYDMSAEPESYVHRIGRTARAGRNGVAYNFCNDKKERNYLERIESLTGEKIPEAKSYPFKSRLRRKEGRKYKK